MDYVVRKARLEEREEIARLIALSARGLSVGDYSAEQVDAALGGVFGVDTELIADGTYFVARAGEELVGCGGWSKKRTLFGGDRYGQREAGELDPQVDAAKIRAFFVHPGWARKGIGRAILARCEAEAARAGFHALELMATLPGVRLYAAQGYEAGERVEYDLGDGVKIEFVPMRKEIEPLSKAEFNHEDTKTRSRNSR
jgi:GNAT superfamily N-acetyltransferase